MRTRASKVGLTSSTTSLSRRTFRWRLMTDGLTDSASASSPARRGCSRSSSTTRRRAGSASAASVRSSGSGAAAAGVLLIGARLGRAATAARLLGPGGARSAAFGRGARSRPVGRLDLLADGGLGLRPGDGTGRGRERPHVALQVDGPVGAVAVELVLGLGGDRGPGCPGPLAVRVDVAAEGDVRALGVDPVDRGRAAGPLGPLATGHDPA